jgi:hypothetical protein
MARLKKSCCKYLSKSLLYFFNAIFILLGLTLLSGAIALKIKDTWSNFLDNRTLSILIAGSLAIILIAMLGCCGAMKERKGYLVPYIFFVFVALLIQGIGCYYLIRYSAAAGNGTMGSVKQDTMRVYANGNCSVDKQAASPQISCDDSHQWFQNFVNRECPVDSSTLADPTVQQCLADNPKTTDQQSNEVYCACRQPLAAKVKALMKPLEIAAVSLVAVEVLLIISACHLVCFGGQRSEEQRDKEVPLLQGAHASW